MATKQQMIDKGTEILQKLNIYKPYIDGFKTKGEVCFFENYAGFWVYQEPEVASKMKWLEETYNCTVYAITHEYTEFGELWDFLIVPPHKSDWAHIADGEDDTFYVYAYVWNKDEEMYSEFGSITVRNLFGGIRRTL